MMAYLGVMLAVVGTVVVMLVLLVAAAVGVLVEGSPSSWSWSTSWWSALSSCW
jgi:hypothetical protein